ncbi:MAG: GxGYxYP family putative glycoside hydrolase, partial [Planctomycetia bacterium]|nr:GxGYxYP family putative glycoside hydrolase [Planctomycetia bacterium]
MRRKSVIFAAVIIGIVGGVSDVWTSEAMEAAGTTFPEPVILYDLEPTQRMDRTDPRARRKAWDEAALVTSLQGIVNRSEPRLYVFFVRSGEKWVDRWWLERFSEPKPDGSPGWLYGRTRIIVESIPSLLECFRDYVRGVVVYDERVPATANLAATIAGVEDLLMIRYDAASDSLYHRLIEDPSGPRLQVVRKLMNNDGTPMFTGTGTIPGTDRPSTGSAKTDAYAWLIAHYVETGKCNPTRIGYYLDAWWLDHPGPAIQNHTLTNRDYVIANRGFFFDLNPWEDESPVDDRAQPKGADGRMFREILRAAYDQTKGQSMIHVAGFTPWDTKYTNYGSAGGTHEPVPTEWRHAEILSAYNAYMDADALGMSAMANASFFSHFPLRPIYPQKKPDLESLRQRGYLGETGRPTDRTFVSIYVGDYDSAAWVYQCMPTIWTDPVRGTIPLGWAINPNLADRFGPGMDWIRDTSTPNDFFVAGDSGAGYINPMNLVEPRPWSGLPSGVDLWVRHCTKYYRQWDLSITGFVLDGNAADMDESMRREYGKFSPDGVVRHRAVGWGMDAVPWIQMQYDLYETDAGAAKILEDTRTDCGPQFLMYRTILWTPSKLKAMFERVRSDPEKGKRIEFVDPYTFFQLIR